MLFWNAGMVHTFLGEGGGTNMRNNALLRLLLAAFLLYMAWPAIPEARGEAAQLFWGIWLLFFLLTAGANLAVLLQLHPAHRVEQNREKRRIRDNH